MLTLGIVAVVALVILFMVAAYTIGTHPPEGGPVAVVVSCALLGVIFGLVCAYAFRTDYSNKQEIGEEEYIEVENICRDNPDAQAMADMLLEDDKITIAEFRKFKKETKINTSRVLEIKDKIKLGVDDES